MSKSAAPSLFSLILAAGEASRFGAPKQLAVLDGQSLLARANALAEAVTGPRRLAVLGAHRAAIQPVMDSLGLAFTVNARWQRGPGTSIAAGVSALPDDCAGVLIWHVDQPLLQTRDLMALRGHWLEATDLLVTARYAGSVGAPALFPRRLFSELASLDPEAGAKSLIAGDQRRIDVDIDVAAVDIDTPGDLAEAQRRINARRERDSRSAHN